MKQSAAEVLVSNATLRNWDRLYYAPSPDVRLTKRANKRLSQRMVLPKEYITNPLNMGAIQAILGIIEDEEIEMYTAICSLCLSLLCSHGLVQNNRGVFTAQKPNIKAFIDEMTEVAPTLVNIQLPLDENDIVGLIYQCLQSEGNKNVKGSYFTPKAIIKALTFDMNTTKATILDPCCGTGSFLLGINVDNPENIYGVDIDPLAVTIAKTNLFIHYKERNFKPNIFCGDFLSVGHTIFDNINISNKYDYIISNPPWGASVPKEYAFFYPEVTSGEVFSYFIAQSLGFLKCGGELRFLLPESILNVRTHQDIRRLILEQTTLKELKLFDRCFSGVFTPVVGVRIENNFLQNSTVYIEKAGVKIKCKQNEYLKNDHCVFTVLSGMDKSIIEAIYRRPHQNLSKSRWALGIVTGDNKNRIFKEQQNDMELIYTGKDVNRYTLKPPTAYVIYDRSTFQQSAPDEIYRAEEKLVYKFISNHLVFAYDSCGSLFLNSANILIPSIDGMSIKTVLALLNSTVFQYLYMKKFGEIKVLRGNLEKLPLPNIDEATNIHLSKLVDVAMQGDASAHIAIQKVLYEVWGLTQTQILHIEEEVYG